MPISLPLFILLVPNALRIQNHVNVPPRKGMVKSGREKKQNGIESNKLTILHSVLVASETLLSLTHSLFLLSSSSLARFVLLKG